MGEEEELISLTNDTDFITQCVTDPRVWEMSADDGCGDPELYFVNMDGSAMWLRAGDYGVFMLHPHNHTTFEAHTVLLPSARGKAVELGKMAVQWAWENTRAERIITNVPEFNPLALRMAKKVGFVEYGFNPDSFKKDGVLYGQTVLGISKGGTSCQS